MARAPPRRCRSGWQGGETSGRSFMRRSIPPGGACPWVGCFILTWIGSRPDLKAIESKVGPNAHSPRTHRMHSPFPESLLMSRA